MASRQDLELAKRLLAARVLTEDQVRDCFGLIEQLAAQGRTASLEAVLYHRGLAARGSLAVLRGPSPLQAQAFAQYRLESELGEGGSSTVYRGTYRPNGSPVAVKVLDPVHALRPTFLQRFQQEAQILIELEHDNIVLGYEIGFENGWHYFSMDLVPGATVLEVIERRGFLENEEALSIMLQCAQALAYLHKAGYLHRDIKPGNIMVEASGQARMIDLGLIRALPRDGAEAVDEGDQMTVGTVEYLSPEQARGHSDLDPRSDIYSLGVSLYHMVVGEVPFQGDNDYETMAKQVLSALDTQKVKQRRIAPEVHFFITKMTSKDRDMRFETVQDVIDAVAGYVRGGQVPVDLGPEPAARPVAPPVARPVAPPVARPVAPPV
ncbi:MAG: serine/threonine-protein kinase, partial [Planctomycetota bacterium]|nr:serine/threonine-protein kinase [Planctomycetota bacterium]